MTERELNRHAAHRLAIIRHAQEIDWQRLQDMPLLRDRPAGLARTNLGVGSLRFTSRREVACSLQHSTPASTRLDLRCRSPCDLLLQMRPTGGPRSRGPYSSAIDFGVADSRKTRPNAAERVFEPRPTPDLRAYAGGNGVP
jgi:hypothetical protein